MKTLKKYKGIIVLSVFVFLLISFILNWSSFKAGFIEGYNEARNVESKK